jgi:hypothetical protein
MKKSRSLTEIIQKVFQRLVLEFFENIRVLYTILRIFFLRRGYSSKSKDESLSIIIFSKDRPLQLEALLESHLYFCQPKIKPVILYSCQSEKYQKAYDDLFSRYKDCTDFCIDDRGKLKETLLEIFTRLEVENIFFLADDELFKGKTNLLEFCNYTSGFVPSLRMGTHLTKNYTQSSVQKMPPLKKTEDYIFWKYSEGEYDWGYPLSVTGHYFKLDEIKLMTEAIDFKGPNSYEEKLQKFKPIFIYRQGISFHKSVIINIPCNKVQSENENIAGDLHQDELLELYFQKKIDFLKLKDFVNESCHQEVTLSFIER